MKAEKFLTENSDWFDKSPEGEKLYFESEVIRMMNDYANEALPMPWIRPQDQMPEENEPVLITDKEGLQIVAWYVAAIDMWYSENHSWFTREVNYWMPIPEIV